MGIHSCNTDLRAAPFTHQACVYIQNKNADSLITIRPLLQLKFVHYASLLLEGDSDYLNFLAHTIDKSGE